MAINQYDPNTGKKLKKGQTVTFNGQKVKQGTTFGAKGSYGYRDSSASDYVDQVGGAAGRFADMTPQEIAKADSIYSTMFDGSNPTKEGTYADGSSQKTNGIFNYSTPTSSVNTKYITPKDLSSDYSKIQSYKDNLFGDYKSASDQAFASYYNDDGTIKSEQDVNDVSSQNQYAIMQQTLREMMDLQENTPTGEELYRKAQKETGILSKQREVANLSSQLGAIQAQGQANQLAVVGQGRGIPEAILGGQQAQFARETAIQSLPVAAALNAAQGNLEMAQQNLSTLFSIKSADAKQRYDFQSNLIGTISQFATKQEENKLAVVNKILDRQYNEQQAIQSKIENIAMMGLQNGASSGVLSKVTNSKTVGEAIRNLGSYGMSWSDKLNKLKFDDAMASFGSGDLTVEQKETLLKNPTAQQAAARIGVIRALEDYKKKVIEMKGEGGFDKNKLTKLEKAELNTAVKTTIASAINVAQGQGAMGKEEGERMIDDLLVNRFRRTDYFTSIAQGTIDAQKSLLDTNLNFIDSSIPGASDNFEVFKQYKLDNLPPEEKKRQQTKIVITDLRNNNFKDDEILEHYKNINPSKASLIDSLFSQGYGIEEIIANI